MVVNELNCTLCLKIFHFKKVVDTVRYILLLQKEGQAIKAQDLFVVVYSQLESLHS